MELLPELVYQINGVKDVPEGGILALRLFALHFIFKGINDLFRPYFTNRKDSKVATGMTILGNLSLPFFALLLSHILPAPFLWLAYLMTELLTCALGQIRYRWWAKKDREKNDSEGKELYVTVKPEEAVEASKMVRKYGIENGAEERIVYRMALCMEEMVAYAVKSQERDDIHIQVRMQFRPGEGAFFMLDDGKCISLNEDTETQELITDNYMLLKRVCKSVEYQYILNMNYTIFRF